MPKIKSLQRKLRDGTNISFAKAKLPVIKIHGSIFITPPYIKIMYLDNIIKSVILQAYILAC